MPERVSTFQYEGFSAPHYTMVPDDVFDLLAPQLTEGELRVLLYIVRRTFGFKKDYDDISLRQMTDGIVARDGRVLDTGTGLAKTSVVRAVKGLIAKGIIVAQRNYSDEKGDEATTYSLRWRQQNSANQPSRSTADPSSVKLHGGCSGKLHGSSVDPSSVKLHGRVAESYPQETVIQDHQFRMIQKKKPDPGTTWTKTLDALQAQMTAANYNTWLSQTEATRWQGDALVITCPSSFVAEWLSQRLVGHVKRELSNIVDHPCNVTFVT